MKTFIELIDLWPDMRELSADVGEKWETVRKWRFRDSIPAHKWAVLMNAAARRGIQMSEQDLIRLASRQDGYVPAKAPKPRRAVA